VTGVTNNYPARAQLEALAGGTVNLPALQTINTGSVILESDGTGSVLDVAALTSFAESRSWTDSALQASNGGTVQASSLASLSSVNLTVAGAGEGLTLGSLTSYASGQITVSGGAMLTLPAPTHFTAPGITATLGGGSSLAIGSGNRIPLPTSGTGVVINVPPLPQGMTLNLNPTGTFAGGTTFNVSAGAIVDIQSGTYTGGAVFNVAQGATLDTTGGQTVTYSGLLTGSGSGTVSLSSGSLVIGIGGATINFPGNQFQWTGGGIN
jgi:hypothetical protein